MPNLEVVLYILIINWKECLVYFTLSCIAGILIFSSCVLGQCLSNSLSKSPRNRSQSIRSRRSLCNGEKTMLKYPGYPHHLGSWNTDRPRPRSLTLEQMSGTLPSPWSLTSGMKVPPSHLRHYSHTMGRLKSDKDDNYTYPWVFFHPTTQQKSKVTHSQTRYSRENMNVV